MRPIDPYNEPLRVNAIDEEVVFLGQGPVNFTMTRSAARLTLHHLAEALLIRRSRSSAAARTVVLLVEDEPLVREIGVMLLEDAGYAVIATDGPKAALLALEAGDEIHLLFTDIHMPGELDGLQLARLVQDRWPSIPLLVTSGRAPPSPDALPSGGRFLAKPYAAADVLRHVDELTAPAH